MAKSCELCKLPARMFCESDQASLCWDCDAKVHSANFLVARHSRNLLCHACQSPMAWSSSGSKLGLAISVCERCVSGYSKSEVVAEEAESEAGNNHEIDTDGERYDEEEDDSEEVDECDVDEDLVDEEEEGDNQVVPWSSTPPPPEATSSSSEESSSRNSNVEREISLKRSRESVLDLSSDDEISSSSSQISLGRSSLHRSGDEKPLLLTRCWLGLRKRAEPRQTSFPVHMPVRDPLRK